MVQETQCLAHIYSNKRFVDEPDRSTIWSGSLLCIKRFYPANHNELEQNIKEHLKWRNGNRRNPLLKKLQKRTYVI